MKKISLKFSDYIKSDNIIILLGLITIIPFLIISFFNHPSADDFSYAFTSQVKGIFNAQKDCYFNWTGRYFSTFFITANPLVFNNFFLFKLIPIGLIISLFLSIYCLINLIFQYLKIKVKIMLSISFLIIYFFQMPIISEGIYWFTSSMVYQLANILSILLLCSIVKLFKTKSIKFLLVSILFSFAVIGSNEVSMLSIDFLVLTIFILNYVISKKLNLLIAILLFFMVVFSIVSIIAPGNSVRETFFSNKQQLIFSVVQSFMATKYSIINWLPFIVLFMLLVLDFLNNCNIDKKSKIFVSNPFIGLIILCALLFIGFFPGFWSLGTCPPSRTVNVIYFFFMLSCIYFLFNLHVYFQKKNIKFVSFSPYVRYLIILLLLINLYKPNNIRTAYRDLISGRAYNYDIQMKSRYCIIKSTRNDTCYIPQLKNIPTTIFVGDITTDVNDWRNQLFSSYMRKAIILRKENK